MTESSFLNWQFCLLISSWVTLGKLYFYHFMFSICLSFLFFFSLLLFITIWILCFPSSLVAHGLGLGCITTVAWVRSLVRELEPCKLHGQKKKKKSRIYACIKSLKKIHTHELLIFLIHCFKNGNKYNIKLRMHNSSIRSLCIIVNILFQWLTSRFLLVCFFVFAV